MKKNLTLLLAIFLFPFTIFAGFATIEDAAIKYDFYNRQVIVNKDGSTEEIVELQMTLLKEQARSFASKYDITYNSDSQAIKVIEAKSIFANQESKVSANMIENKSIASRGSGFDDIKQVSISFPKTEIGGQIYIKFKLDTTKVPIDKNFFTRYYFGLDGYWQNAKVTIDSAIALNINVNDPYDKLLITQEEIKNTNKATNNILHKVQIVLKKPLINSVINEISNSLLNPKKLTYVSLSTLTSWQQLGNQLYSQYAKINTLLPPLLEEIVNTSSKIIESTAQINQVTSLLNEKIQYFGDWRSVKGKFVAQDFDVVVQKQSGDCKDFAMITTKILQSLGYKANIALVLRGYDQPTPLSLPLLSQFNHAIVKAIDAGGKTYWIDPTNSISMTEGIFPDIAGKYVLVLDEDKSLCDKIPDINCDYAKKSITTIVSTDLSNRALTTINLYGQQATMLTGLGLYASVDSIESYVYQQFVANEIAYNNRIKTTIPNLNSRIVAPITISVNYVDPKMFVNTNVGLAYSLEHNLNFLQALQNFDIAKDVNDLYLGYPRTLERKIIFKNTKIANLDNLNLQLKSSYIRLSRKCYIEGDDSIISEIAQVNRSWIENEELKTEEFKVLQKNLQQKASNTFVVLPIQ